MTRKLTATIEREADGYVALCPEVDVVSQGDTVSEARDNLEEALGLFFETASAEEVEARLRDEITVIIPVRGPRRPSSEEGALASAVRHTPGSASCEQIPTATVRASRAGDPPNELPPTASGPAGLPSSSPPAPEPPPHNDPTDPIAVHRGPAANG